jgi:hypothetical protein
MLLDLCTLSDVTQIVFRSTYSVRCDILYVEMTQIIFVFRATYFVSIVLVFKSTYLDVKFQVFFHAVDITKDVVNNAWNNAMHFIVPENTLFKTFKQITNYDP